MGYALATSACFGCGKLFSYNPVRVPSIRDPNRGNERVPVCGLCIQRANIQRAKSKLPPLVAHPEAYIACNEEELNYD